MWIHGDITCGNLLAQDGRISAVIDFGPLGVGDPAVDLLIGWSLTEPSRQLFREELGVDDATWIRGRGWAITTSLIALPYYRRTNPGIVAESMLKLDEVLADVRSS